MDEDARLQAMLETTRTLGWRYIVEDAMQSIKDRQAGALEAPDWDTVNVLRGEALQLAYLTNLEMMVENILDDAINVPAED